MSVRDLPEEKIAQLLSDCPSERKRLEQKNRRLQKSIDKLDRQIRENKDKDLRFKAIGELLSQSMFIRKCVPDSVAELHARRHELVARASRTDITVAEQKLTLEQVRRTKTELQKSCPHPLVVYESGYAGSSSYDYDDTHRGCHARVICGLVAHDDDYHGKNSRLPDDGSRLFNRLYDECCNGQETKGDETLNGRLSAYLALATVEEVINRFFGARRLTALQKLLEA